VLSHRRQTPREPMESRKVDLETPKADTCEIFGLGGSEKSVRCVFSFGNSDGRMAFGISREAKMPYQGYHGTGGAANDARTESS